MIAASIKFLYALESGEEEQREGKGQKTREGVNREDEGNFKGANRDHIWIHAGLKLTNKVPVISPPQFLFLQQCYFIRDMARHPLTDRQATGSTYNYSAAHMRAPLFRRGH